MPEAQPSGAVVPLAEQAEGQCNERRTDGLAEKTGGA